MSKLITALLHASAAMQGLASETDNPKIAGQLVMVQLAFVDIAQQLRQQTLSVPSAAIDACVKEVEDTRRAAQAASGTKDDGKYALVVLEGNEAISVIHSHAGGSQEPRGFPQGPLIARPPGGGWPGPFPTPPWFWPPRPWPPRPWPPRPWPGPPVNPWDPRAWNSWENGPGNPDNDNR